MIIQEQKWANHTRILIVDEYASVQLEIFDKPQFGSLNITAFIYNLWTAPEHRRKGYAKRMLAVAEREAASHGQSSVFLDWNLKDTPHAIREWYMRNGYAEVGFNSTGDYSRLKKELNTTKQ